MRPIWYIASGLLIGVILGFQVVDTSELFVRSNMHEYYQNRMRQFHEEYSYRCHKEALTQARQQVDSIMIGKRILIDVDSFLLRPKPTKPEKPTFNFSIDSQSVEPLFIHDSMQVIK